MPLFTDSRFSWSCGPCSSLSPGPAPCAPLQEAAEELARNPGLAQAVKSQIQKIRGGSADLVDTIISDPRMASILRSDEAQILKKALNSVPQIKNVFSKGKVGPSGGHASYISQLMRKAELDAFPDLGAVFSKFSGGMKAFGKVKAIRQPEVAAAQIFERTGTQNVLANPVRKEAMKELLPKKIFGEIKRTSDVAAVGRGIKNIATFPFRRR